MVFYGRLRGKQVRILRGPAAVSKESDFKVADIIQALNALNNFMTQLLVYFRVMWSEILTCLKS